MNNVRYFFFIYFLFLTPNKIIDKKNESDEILNFALQIIHEFNPNEHQNIAKSLFFYKLFIYNNCACLSTCNGDLDKSKNQLNSLLEDTNNLNVVHFALITNNLATIYLKQKDYIKAYKYCESGLFKLEPVIFKQMKDPSTNVRNFCKDLMILLQGYLNYAKCLAILQSIPDKISDLTIKTQILNKNPMTFYRNGHKLSCKYIGQESYLAKKFLFHIHRGPEKILNPIRIETTFDETTTPYDFTIKSNLSEKNNFKKNFPINELSESATQEDSFDKTFDEKEIGHKKDFRIKKKTHHRNYKSQIEFGNTSNFNKFNEKEYYEVVDRMREMEENLKKIQELREKYKFEKQLIESDYNYIKTKSLDYFNPQNRITAQFTPWSVSPPNNYLNKQPFISSAGFDNYWHQPMNFMESTNPFQSTNLNNVNNLTNLTNMNNNNNNLNLNPCNNVNTLNNLNNPLINPISDTNRNSNLDSEEKNNDFEKILISLKNDKDKILKENHEKDREIQKLKDFLNKKEKDINKNQISSDSFIEEEPNFPHLTHEQPKEPKGIPAHHKKSHSQAQVQANKPIKAANINNYVITPSLVQTLPSPQKEVKDVKDIKDLKLNAQVNIPNKKTEIHLESPQTTKGGNPDKIQVNSFNSVTSLPVDANKNKINPKENNIVQMASIQSISTLQDNNAISKKTALLKSESNKSLVKLISIMEKKGSIKNIKIENKRRTSLLENGPKISTPYEVFKTLIIPKFSVVKKKILMENEQLILFEFRTLVNDNNETVYRIEGYNLETAKAFKTAIMKEDILKKVLDSINYEDIIPLTHPLKSISKFLDFVKYFIMPFMGVIYYIFD